LMKRHEGMEGILYLAVGEGEGGWDAGRPIPVLTNAQLTNEVYRIPLLSNQVVYLNNDGQPVDTPTTLLEVAGEIKGEEVVTNGSQPLREFGLFGGDATGEPNSGYMIDHVTHERYDLTPELTLNRKIRLTFTDAVISKEKLTEFGATLPVMSIDGIGDAYTADLSSQGVQTFSDLVDIDPLLSVEGIPQVKLREFRAKARIVMSLKVTLAPFASLADQNISDLLMENPEKIAEKTGLSEVTAEMASRFQEELAVLQIALDNVQLQRITLGDLINT